MGKDTTDRAERVLERIEIARLAPNETPPRARPSIRNVDMAAGPDEHGVWTIDQRRGQPRSAVGRAIYSGLLDYWEAAIDDAYMKALARRCICCGAPASEVQHD